jgi:hypothetical protein
MSSKEEGNNSKLHIEIQKTTNSQSNCKKKRHCMRHHNTQLHCRAIVTQTVWYVQHIDESSRTKDQQNYCGHLIFPQISKAYT